MPFKFSPCAPCCAPCPDLFSCRVDWGSGGYDLDLSGTFAGHHAGWTCPVTGSNAFISFSGDFINNNGNETITVNPKAAHDAGLWTGDYIDAVFHIAWWTFRPLAHADFSMNVRTTWKTDIRNFSYTTYVTHPHCLYRPTLIARLYRDCTYELFWADQNSCCDPPPPSTLTFKLWLLDPAGSGPTSITLTYDAAKRFWRGTGTASRGTTTVSVQVTLECLVNGQYRGYVYFWNGGVGADRDVCAYTDGFFAIATCSPSFGINAATPAPVAILNRGCLGGTMWYSVTP